MSLPSTGRNEVTTIAKTKAYWDTLEAREALDNQLGLRRSLIKRRCGGAPEPK